VKYFGLVEEGYSWGIEFTDGGLKENFRKYGKAPQHEAVLRLDSHDNVCLAARRGSPLLSDLDRGLITPMIPQHCFHITSQQLPTFPLPDLIGYARFRFVGLL